MKVFTSLLEVVGLILVAVAFGLVDFRAGIGVAGVELVVLGVLLDRPGPVGRDGV